MASLIDENDEATLRQRVASIRSAGQNKMNEIESGLDYLVSLKTNPLITGSVNSADYIAEIDSLIADAQIRLQEIRDKYN